MSDLIAKAATHISRLEHTWIKNLLPTSQVFVIGGIIINRCVSSKARQGLTAASIPFDISNQDHKVNLKTIKKILDDTEIGEPANSGQTGQPKQSGSLSKWAQPNTKYARLGRNAHRVSSSAAQPIAKWPGQPRVGTKRLIHLRSGRQEHVALISSA